jgi:hypothetical protein
MQEDSMSVVSSDDVISAYRELLSDAQHQNVILRAQLTKLQRAAASPQQADQGNPQNGQIARQMPAHASS